MKTNFQRGLNTLDFDVAAKHVGIRVGRFAEVVFIVRTHGEKSGINFRQNAGKAHRFISAEVDLDRHSLRRAVLYHLFDVFDVFCGFNHTQSMPEKRKNIQKTPKKYQDIWKGVLKTLFSA